MKLTEKQIERITKEANSREVIKECESHVSFPQTIQRWMVKRVLRAYEKANIRQRP